MEVAYLAAFGSALCFGVAAVLQDRAAKRETSGSLAKVTTSPSYLLGLGLDLVGWLLSLVALQDLPLFAVQAIAASSIGVTVVLVSVLTRRRPPGRQVLVLVALGAGLVALALSAAPDEPRKVSGAFDIGMWIGVAVVAALGFVLSRSRGNRGAAIVGALSGLGYGGTALCGRALEADGSFVEVLKDPLLYALLAFGALGITLFARALQLGAVTVATACQFAVETVVPAAVGLIFLGDRARDGFVVLAYVGFVVTVVAVVALTFLSPDEELEPAGIAP